VVQAGEEEKMSFDCLLHLTISHRVFSIVEQLADTAPTPGGRQAEFPTQEFVCASDQRSNFILEIGLSCNHIFVAYTSLYPTDYFV